MDVIGDTPALDTSYGMPSRKGGLSLIEDKVQFIDHRYHVDIASETKGLGTVLIWHLSLPIRYISATIWETRMNGLPDEYRNFLLIEFALMGLIILFEILTFSIGYEATVLIFSYTIPICALSGFFSYTMFCYMHLIKCYGELDLSDWFENWDTRFLNFWDALKEGRLEIDRG